MILEALVSEEARDLARRATEAIATKTADGVIIRCWDKAEADEVRARIPEHLRGKIQVTWMTFHSDAD